MDSTPTEQQVEQAFDEDYTEFYFNNAQVGYTAFDIYAYLGNMRLTPNKDQRMVQRARIITSPMEAKLLYRFLGNAIKQYESVYGEVAIPEGFEDEG